MVISTTSNKLLLSIKWKAKNIILFEQFRNPIKQNRKKRHTDTPSTQIHNLLQICLDKSTSIKCGGVKLVVWAKTSSFNGMMQSSMNCAKLSGPKLPFLMKCCNHQCIVQIKAFSEHELYISTLYDELHTFLIEHAKTKDSSLAEEQPVVFPQTHISFTCFELSLTEQTLK
jgi:hypothetical protein